MNSNLSGTVAYIVEVLYQGIRESVHLSKEDFAAVRCLAGLDLLEVLLEIRELRHESFVLIDVGIHRIDTEPFFDLGEVQFFLVGVVIVEHGRLVQLSPRTLATREQRTDQLDAEMYEWLHLPLLN